MAKAKQIKNTLKRRNRKTVVKIIKKTNKKTNSKRKK